MYNPYLTSSMFDENTKEDIADFFKIFFFADFLNVEEMAIK